MKEFLWLETLLCVTMPWTYVSNDFNGEEIFGKFYQKDLQKANQAEKSEKSNQEKRW